jgi:hypothetical protein
MTTLLRVVAPAVTPTPADLEQIVDVLAAHSDTRGTSVAVDGDLQPARKSAEPAFANIVNEADAPACGFVRSGSRP